MSGHGWPSHDKDEQARIARCYTEADQERGCPLCIARAENERLGEALRHCARELQYVLDADPCEQREVHQSGEAQACVALAESLLGPMREWAEEPNASMSATLAAKREDR